MFDVIVFSFMKFIALYQLCAILHLYSDITVSGQGRWQVDCGPIWSLFSLNLHIPASGV